MESTPKRFKMFKNALRAEAPKTSGRGKTKSGNSQSRRSSVSQAHFASDLDELSVIRLVGNQVTTQNPPYDGAVGGRNADPADVSSDEALELQRQMRKPLTDLEIEVLSDLDVVIIRGNKADVQEMTRLLKELERLSTETEPKVEIYPLQHVRGESLAVLIDKVNSDLTGGIRGRVTITPLVKPNALLIIGWGETVTSVKELIRQLDQPVPPDVQFQVFRLKYAEVTPARTTVQEFFTARTPTGTGGSGTTTNPGLAPRVQVTADLRTNSLIVQAPPRDMQEAAELIKELDVPSGDVTHRAQIFKLRNSLAADVALVLQSAIDAARGREGALRATAAQISSMLEFLSIDKEGQQVMRTGVLHDVKVTADPRDEFPRWSRRHRTSGWN